MEEVIAKNLIKLLKLNNLTQKQLADKLKIKLQVVNRWEFRHKKKSVGVIPHSNFVY